MLLTFAALIVGLFVRPDITLDMLWYVLIPVLPATFLVNTALWRGVCPLATLNMLASRQRDLALTRGWTTKTAAIGVGLLFVMVPARHLIFNTSGVWLGVTMTAVALLALGLGLVVRPKGGFCNSICPLLPVEKLYGQAPLISAPNPRCSPCTLCTAKGCLDLDPSKSLRAALGNSTTVRDWIRTPFGVFAAAFPGFIFGYFQVGDVATSHWYVAYGIILSFSLGSLALTAFLAAALRDSINRLLPVLGALAVGIYYWYAAPASLAAFGLPGGILLRWVLVAFVAIWLAHALKRTELPPSRHRPRSARPAALRVTAGSAPR